MRIERYRITHEEAERAAMFTKKDSDILKDAGCGLSARIADAFGQIESMDIHVAKISMPLKGF